MAIKILVQQILDPKILSQKIIWSKKIVNRNYEMYNLSRGCYFLTSLYKLTKNKLFNYFKQFLTFQKKYNNYDLKMFVHLIHIESLLYLHRHIKNFESLREFSWNSLGISLEIPCANKMIPFPV